MKYAERIVRMKFKEFIEKEYSKRFPQEGDFGSWVMDLEPEEWFKLGDLFRRNLRKKDLHKTKPIQYSSKLGN